MTEVIIAVADGDFLEHADIADDPDHGAFQAADEDVAEPGVGVARVADVAGPVAEAARADDAPRVVRVVADGERVDSVVGGGGQDLADVFVEDFVGEERFQGAHAGSPAGVFL